MHKKRGANKRRHSDEGDDHDEANEQRNDRRDDVTNARAARDEFRREQRRVFAAIALHVRRRDYRVIDKHAASRRRRRRRRLVGVFALVANRVRRRRRRRARWRELKREIGVKREDDYSRRCGGIIVSVDVLNERFHACGTSLAPPHLGRAAVAIAADDAKLVAGRRFERDNEHETNAREVASRQRPVKRRLLSASRRATGKKCADRSLDHTAALAVARSR